MWLCAGRADAVCAEGRPGRVGRRDRESGDDYCHGYHFVEGEGSLYGYHCPVYGAGERVRALGCDGLCEEVSWNHDRLVVISHFYQSRVSTAEKILVGYEAL